jgi:hypothetical protein
MKKLFIIFFSSKKEADFLLFHSKIKFKKNGNQYIFDNSAKIIVIITGIGRKKTQESMNNIEIENPYMIIKFGTCAVIDGEFDLLQPFIPDFIGSDEGEIKIAFNKLTEDLKKNIKLCSKGLYTSLFPYKKNDKIENLLKKNYGFIDMESFYHVRKFRNILPIMIGSDRGDIKDFITNLKSASEKFKEIFEKIFFSI